MKAKEKLKQKMAEYEEEVRTTVVFGDVKAKERSEIVVFGFFFVFQVVVHALGFSQGHCGTFLEDLTYMGTADGTYSYVRPEEGDAALEERLVGLLEATTGNKNYEYLPYDLIMYIIVLLFRISFRF